MRRLKMETSLTASLKLSVDQLSSRFAVHSMFLCHRYEICTIFHLHFQGQSLFGSLASLYFVTIKLLSVSGALRRPVSQDSFLNVSSFCLCFTANGQHEPTTAGLFTVLSSEWTFKSCSKSLLTTQSASVGEVVVVGRGGGLQGRRK